MNILCKNLLETYNADILTKEKSLIQDLFYKYSNENFEGNKGNTVLMKLIKNYYDNKKDISQKINKIGGPISLTLQCSDKYNMSVYIFGEYHSSGIDCQLEKEDIIKELRKDCPSNYIRDTNSGKCFSEYGSSGHKIKNSIVSRKHELIEDFLTNLFRKTSAFIDFYIETPGYKGRDYIGDEKHPYDQGNLRIWKLSKRFYECLSSIKRKTNSLCNLVRVHYIDIRSNVSNIEVNDVSYLRSFRSDKDNKWLYNKRVFKTIKKLVSENTYEYQNFWKEQLLQSNISKKEFLRTTLPKKFLLNFFEKEIIKSAMIHREYFQSKFKTYNTNNINIDDIMKGIEHTIPPNSVVIDMYTISRMFKKFKNVKNQPENPHNIILYAGEAHSTMYRTFFKELDFKNVSETKGVSYNYFNSDLSKKKYKSNSSYNNCVDISNFKQPFFSS